MLSKRLKVPIALFPKNSRVILRDTYGTVRSAPNGLSHNRFGVTFKSKSFKTAVLRNKWKRAIFNYFRNQIVIASRQPAAKQSNSAGKDILIILDPAIIGKEKEIKTILEKYDRAI